MVLPVAESAMRGSAQQYPMTPSAQPQSFPVVVHPGAVPVPHQTMMQIPPGTFGMPRTVPPQYMFQPSVYGVPMVR